MAEEKKQEVEVEQKPKKEPCKFKKFMFRIFEEHNVHDPLCMTVDILYIFLIFASITICILEVTQIFHENIVIEIIDYVLVGFFAIEWLSSLYTADIEFSHLPYWKAKFRWIFSVESICDIICFVVFLISLLPIKGISDEVDTFLRFIVLIKLIKVIKWMKYPVFKKGREIAIEKAKSRKEERENKKSPKE